jgi:hypothetical protein
MGTGTENPVARVQVVLCLDYGFIADSTGNHSNHRFWTVFSMGMGVCTGRGPWENKKKKLQLSANTRTRGHQVLTVGFRHSYKNLFLVILIQGSEGLSRIN